MGASQHFAEIVPISLADAPTESQGPIPNPDDVRCHCSAAGLRFGDSTTARDTTCETGCYGAVCDAGVLVSHKTPDEERRSRSASLLPRGILLPSFLPHGCA